MRRKILALGIATTILFWAGLGYAFENGPEGFRGLMWGDPPTPAMEFLTKQDEWMSLCQNPGDKLKLGDAQFYIIIYQFYAPSNATVRRLMSVGLYFKDKENFELLKTICKVKFGEPASEGFHKLGWASLTSIVTLTYDSLDEDGFLGLGSTPIMKQYTQEKEKKQAEGAEKDW